MDDFKDDVKDEARNVASVLKRNKGYIIAGTAALIVVLFLATAL